MNNDTVLCIETIGTCQETAKDFLGRKLSKEELDWVQGEMYESMSEALHNVLIQIEENEEEA